ncbi:hypothetical protein Tco_0414146 [Tanacetum coccineum]
MWQPQLRIEATLGTYHGAIGARHIISQVRVLLGVVNVTSLVTRKGKCRTRIPVARDNSLQNVTCFVLWNHGTPTELMPRVKETETEGNQS